MGTPSLLVRFLSLTYPALPSLVPQQALIKLGILLHRLAFRSQHGFIFISGAFHPHQWVATFTVQLLGPCLGSYFWAIIAKACLVRFLLQAEDGDSAWQSHHNSASASTYSQHSRSLWPSSVITAVAMISLGKDTWIILYPKSDACYCHRCYSKQIVYFLFIWMLS